MTDYINQQDTKNFKEWLLDILELKTKYAIGNYIDIFLNNNGRIILHTKNGGNNRKHSNEYLNDEGKNCNCVGCIMTYQIPQNPHYMGDYDDDNDSNYAYIVYRVPKKYENACKKQATNAPFMNCNIY